jgi:hypothetical protein
MRFHHGYGWHYGHGWHPGCGWGPQHGWGWADFEDYPAPRWRGRVGDPAGWRRATAAQLEAYRASLQDELRAVEQDLADLAATEDNKGKSVK